MKGLLKILSSKLFLVGLFSLGIVIVNAQIPVSKGVQKYANKKLFENVEQERVSVQSVATPEIVVSKDVHKIGNGNVENQSTKGNMISKGYPYWAIAKGVHHHHRSDRNLDYITRNK